MQIISLLSMIFMRSGDLSSNPFDTTFWLFFATHSCRIAHDQVRRDGIQKDVRHELQEHHTWGAGLFQRRTYL